MDSAKQCKIKALTLLFLLVSLASGKPVQAPGKISRVPGKIQQTSIYCVTSYGTTPLRLVATQTQSSTNTHVFTNTVDVTPSTTITSAASTTTISTTTTETITTTAVQSTDTSTTTITNTDTETTTTTSTSTETDTATTTVSTTIIGTTTIATGAAFTPIASDASVVNSGGGHQFSMKRSNTSPNKASTIFSKNKLGSSAARYPSGVTCYKNVDIWSFTTITRTEGKLSTIFAPAPPQSTVTTTFVISSTTTEIPAAITETETDTATITETDTETVDSTSTTTTTSTTTSTSFQAIATQYDACASNNIIDTIGGQRFDQVGVYGTFNTVSTASAKDCCALCQAMDSCVGFAYVVPTLNPGCFLDISAEACNPTQQAWFFYSDSGSFMYGYAVGNGNGNCGRGTYDGSVS